MSLGGLSTGPGPQQGLSSPLLLEVVVNNKTFFSKNIFDSFLSGLKV